MIYPLKPPFSSGFPISMWGFNGAHMNIINSQVVTQVSGITIGKP